MAQYCQGKRVLDLFTYTGAFAAQRAQAWGADSVLGIDSSSTAIEVARHHAVLNQLGKARFESADVFDALETMRGERPVRRRDLRSSQVCPPPERRRGRLEGLSPAQPRARSEVLEPDGILVTCSCSGLVDRGLFADLIGQVAELSGRSIQILEQRGQAPDHPVSASCLETRIPEVFRLPGFLKQNPPVESKWRGSAPSPSPKVKRRGRPSPLARRYSRHQKLGGPSLSQATGQPFKCSLLGIRSFRPEVLHLLDELLEFLLEIGDPLILLG